MDSERKVKVVRAPIGSSVTLRNPPILMILFIAFIIGGFGGHVCFFQHVPMSQIIVVYYAAERMYRREEYCNFDSTVRQGCYIGKHENEVVDICYGGNDTFDHIRNRGKSVKRRIRFVQHRASDCIPKKAVLNSVHYSSHN